MEVITGMVLEAGSRLKIEAARDRGRVRKWALEAVVPRKRRTLVQRAWKPPTRLP